MTVNQLIAILILALFPCAAAATITIETVPVGDAGNPNDPATGSLRGGVSYAYNIGNTEVTVGQYTAFLNAVASTDTYQLYRPEMQFDPHVAGIGQIRTVGCNYFVIGSPLHPIAYVSFGDAARFTNWLHNGQPTGAQGPGTTEDGAYTLNGATTAADLTAKTRNPGAKWFIPTENDGTKPPTINRLRQAAIQMASGGTRLSPTACPIPINRPAQLRITRTLQIS